MQRLDEAMANLEAAIDTLTHATAATHNAYSAAQNATQAISANVNGPDAISPDAISTGDLQALKAEIAMAIKSLNKLAGNSHAPEPENVPVPENASGDTL